jgi:hypothetical protein
MALRMALTPPTAQQTPTGMFASCAAARLPTLPERLNIATAAKGHVILYLGMCLNVQCVAEVCRMPHCREQYAHQSPISAAMRQQPYQRVRQPPPPVRDDGYGFRVVGQNTDSESDEDYSNGARQRLLLWRAVPAKPALVALAAAQSCTAITMIQALRTECLTCDFASRRQLRVNHAFSVAGVRTEQQHRRRRFSMYVLSTL